MYLLSLLQLLIVKALCFGHFFISDTPLDMEEKIQHGCVRLEKLAQNARNKCALLCSEDSSCMGISLDNSSQCFLHYQCPSINSSGLLTNNDHRYMIKSETAFPCLHEGVWQEHNDRCVCKYGWIGKYCDTMAKNCYELRYSGYDSDTHLVYLDLRNDITSPVRVWCRINPSSGYSYAWLTINTGTSDYNKTYMDFVNGFGVDLRDSYFIGLETLYLLNQVGYKKLYFDLDIGSSAKYYGRYDFSMSNSTNGYTLKVLGDWSYSKNDVHGFSLRNCFQPLQGMSFSTWDFDNDGDAGSNCAAEAGTGWWFSGCNTMCNLLGKWFGSDTPTSSAEVIKLASVDLGVLNPQQMILYVFLPP